MGETANRPATQRAAAERPNQASPTRSLTRNAKRVPREHRPHHPQTRRYRLNRETAQHRTRRDAPTENPASGDRQQAAGHAKRATDPYVTRLRRQRRQREIQSLQKPTHRVQIRPHPTRLHIQNRELRQTGHARQVGPRPTQLGTTKPNPERHLTRQRRRLSIPPIPQERHLLRRPIGKQHSRTRGPPRKPRHDCIVIQPRHPRPALANGPRGPPSTS